MKNMPQLSSNSSLVMPTLTPQNSLNEPKTCSKSTETCCKRVDNSPIYTPQQAYNQKDKAKRVDV